MLVFVLCVSCGVCFVYLAQKIIPVHVREPKGIIGQAIPILDGQPPSHVVKTKEDEVPSKCKELVVVCWSIYKQCA